MKKVPVYRCECCGEEFELEQGIPKKAQVCPECGCMDFRFVRTQEVEE